MDIFLARLGDEINDVDEETFDIFSEPTVSQDLGMVDPKAPSLDVTVAGRDFKLEQSPGVLQSTRGGGTTGAAVWKSSILLAEWMAWSHNPLFRVIESTVLELGAGISGLVPLVVAPKVRRVIATDQAYVMKTLQANIAANLAGPVTKQKRKSGKSTNSESREQQSNIEAFALDWENDDIASVLTAHGLEDGVELIVACDCVYNYALVDPLVQTCADICRMRLDREGGHAVSQSTLCVIAQQLRQPDVFEQWLETFHRSFRVWRVPEDLLSPGLKAGCGFVVHVGLLRSSMSLKT